MEKLFNRFINKVKTSVSNLINLITPFSKTSTTPPKSLKKYLRRKLFQYFLKDFKTYDLHRGKSFRFPMRRTPLTIDNIPKIIKQLKKRYNQISKKYRNYKIVRLAVDIGADPRQYSIIEKTGKNKRVYTRKVEIKETTGTSYRFRREDKNLFNELEQKLYQRYFELDDSKDGSPKLFDKDTTNYTIINFYVIYREFRE